MNASAILFLLLSSIAFAKPQPVSLDFQNVGLVTFGQAVFKAILHRDFVISPEVMSLDRRVTVAVKTIDAAELPQFVDGILAQQGIQTTVRDGVFYLNVKQGVTPADAMQPVAKKPDSELAPQSRDADRYPIAENHVINEVSVTYTPQYRATDFLAPIVAAAYGQRSAIAAGGVLVLVGQRSVVDGILQLLSRIDVDPRKVEISASWIECTENAGSSRGLALIANVLGAKLGITLGSATNSTISLRTTPFQLVLDTLNTDGRFHQVSNSRVVADEYDRASLIVGDETPTVASSGRDNAGNAVQSLVYRPSGVIVDVLPRVLGAGKINLQIDGQISSFKATSTGVSGSPTLIKRQVKTTVTVENGEVLLIGGLNDAQASDANSALPFLPAQWSMRSSSKTNTDLVLILSANAVK